MAEEIIGNYRLKNLMVTGQSSQVWEVVETNSLRHFAMKILLPEKAEDSRERKLMFHEAFVGKQLAHPNVIRIVDVSNPRDRKVPPYYVMEYFPAGSLKIRLLRMTRKPEFREEYLKFIKERGMSICKQAATALAYMNASGWVHRDVKPDNMLVNAAGDLKIIDFALSQRIEKPSFLGKLFKRKRAVQGTRSYMSPEQIRGEALDGRSDIYSYGASLYELLTYRPPFRGATNQELLEKHILEKPTSPQAHNVDITDEMAALILRCLAKKREERYPTFHDVLMGLKNIRVFKSDPTVPREE